MEKASKDDFLYEDDPVARFRKRHYEGKWICKTCGKVAKTEHKKEECHLCRDWGGCNADCTLSKVYCEKCKKEMLK